MSLFSEDFETLVRLASELADVAAVETLARFRSASLVTSNKLDDGAFDPVTQADKGAEAAMRKLLVERRPNDGVFGEEQERTFGTSGLTWVLDPIDGTRAFISGMPVWGTLIGLDDGSKGRIGVIDQPYIGERFIGVMTDTPRAWLETRDGTRDIRTRRGVSLDQATVFTTDPYLFDSPEAAAFDNVRKRARLTRFGTDCYAYALLALGQIDAVIESGLQAYDVASHVPLIQAAGGIVTDWSANDCRWGGQVIAAGSAALHAELLEHVRSAAKPSIASA